MQIRAAVLHQVGQPFQVETLDLEGPKAGEVLVKVAAAGVCHSDYHLVTGASKHPLPVVPGHEGAGFVEAIGPGVSDIQPGDFVVLNWAPNCGECFYCQHGRPSLCSTYLEPIWAGTMMDGTARLSRNEQPVFHFSALACFAEYAVVPQESCVRLSKDVRPEVAAIIGCAVTTGVGAVLYTADVQAGSSVVVFGAGGVGLSVILGAKLAGASRIIAVDTNQPKLDLARSLGATHGLTAGPNAVDEIKELTEGRGADYVFEAIGLTSVQEQSLYAARSGGTVVLAGISPMGSQTNLPGAIITRRELTVKGSYYGTANTSRDFPLFADLYLQGKLDLDKLISKTYSLDQINEAYTDMLGGKIARGVIVF